MPRMQNTSGRAWQFITQTESGVELQRLDDVHEHVKQHEPQTAGERIFKEAIMHYYASTTGRGERTPLETHQRMHLYKSALASANAADRLVAPLKQAYVKAQQHANQLASELLAGIDAAMKET